MSAIDRFVFPVAIPMDGNGDPYPGGKLYFFVTGTSTPSPVYSNAALSTPIVQPVEADANGAFPTIFLDPDVTYKVEFYDQNDDLQDTFDPVRTRGTSDARTYATYAALRAATPLTNDTAWMLGYYAEGDGGGGFFWWDAASTATHNAGTVIQPAAGGTGRWKRIFDGPANLLMYGCKGDDSTDNATAMQLAINDNYGKTLRVPEGVFRTSVRLHAREPIIIQGDSWDSEIKITSAIVAILFQNGDHPDIDFLDGAVLRDLSVNGNGTGQLDGGLVQFNACRAFVCNNVHVFDGGTPFDASQAGGAGINGIGVSAGFRGGPMCSGTISNCLIERTTKAAINISTECKGVDVINNKIRDCYGNGSVVGADETPGIQLAGSVDVIVKGNIISDVSGAGILAGATHGGDALPSDETYKDTVRVPLRPIIVGNSCLRSGRNGILVQNPLATSSQPADGLIENNVCMFNAEDGISLEGARGWKILGNKARRNGINGISIFNSRDVSVDDNDCSSNNIGTDTGEPHANIESITVSSTTATVTTKAAHGLSNGATVYITDTVNKRFNDSFTIASAGGDTFTITISGSPDDAQDCGVVYSVPNTSAGAGISLAFASVASGVDIAQNIAITNNRCYDDNPSATQVWGIYISPDSQTISGLTIAGNKFRNNTSGTITIDGTALMREFDFEGDFITNTTNGSTTNIFGFDLPEESVAFCKIQAVGIKQDGAARSGYEVVATIFRASGGSATILGTTPTTLHSQETGGSNTDCSFQVGSNALAAYVTGIAAENWRWNSRITYRVQYYST